MSDKELRGKVKKEITEELSLVSQFFAYRKISFYIVKILVKTRIKPNHITILEIIIFFMSMGLVATGQHKYMVKETRKFLIFLTNNFHLSAYTITQIYKARWQIEVFFKWIKQNLKIKTFLGTSKNAVLTQIWIAMCYFLLLTYIKYQSKYKYSLFYLHKIIRETILERLNLIDLLNINDKILSKVIPKEQEPQLALNF